MNIKQGASGLALVSVLTCAGTDHAQERSGELLSAAGLPRGPHLSQLSVDSSAASFSHGLGDFYFPALPDEIIARDTLHGSVGQIGKLAPAGVQAGFQPSHPDFVVSAALRPRVDFWIRVFTTSSTVEIFHHRKLPWIEYARMDFSEQREALSAADYQRHRRKAVAEKVQEIHTGLRNLARGHAPANELEQQLAAIFAQFPDPAQALREASSERKLVRAQKGIAELFAAAIARSGAYLPEMAAIFAARDLPPELLCLPAIESAFNDYAGSSVGAAGRWQFMRATARLHGLRVDRAVDERRDPLRATEAAARYLAEAHAELGNWPLAVTSYNHGVVGIRNSVARARTTDLHELIEYAGTHKLPAFGFATSNFFPELLAACEIFAEHERYFPDVQPAQALEFSSYVLKRSHSAARASAVLGVPLETLRELNPALNERVWSGKLDMPSSYELRVPLAGAVQELAALDTARQPYVVKPGDSLMRIAGLHNVPVSDLKRWNGLTNDVIRAGQRLHVWSVE